MDPLSQAITGAAFAGLFSKRRTIRPALLLGALAGMAPDLDIFIRSETDPLMALEYHRHFTHSIAFSPIGGLICAAFFYLLPYFRKQLTFTKTWLFCFAGLFTHGLLDACTGYGTHLLWPFINDRESWNIIGIIDPLYTLPALFILMTASYHHSRKITVFAVICMISYLGLGLYQEQRATTIATAWLKQQRTEHEQLTLRPTIGNLWLWRMLYLNPKTQEWETHALYLPYWNAQNISIKEGETVPRFTETMMAQYPEETTTGQDIRRFDFFSNHYLSRHDLNNSRFYIGDIRYGMTPDSAQPLWGVEAHKDLNKHVVRHANLRGTVNWGKVESLLKGEGFTPIR